MKYYTLSHPQKRILYNEAFFLNTLSLTFTFKESVNYNMLKSAIDLLLSKNNSLFIKLAEIDGQVKQYIDDDKPIHIDYLDFSGKAGLDRQLRWLNQKVKTPFDNIKSNLFYIAMIKYYDGNGGFFFSIHHIISDAWTCGLIGDQIYEGYLNLINNKEISQEKRPSYIEFVIKENEYINSQRCELNRQFWTDKFKILPEPLKLKTKKLDHRDCKAERFVVYLDSVVKDDVENFCIQNRISKYNLFLTALIIYLFRITGRDDMVIGTVTHNRTGAREKKMVGMFINTIPLRISGIKKDRAVLELFQLLVSELTGVYKNQKYPFDLLVEDMRKDNKDLMELIEVIFSYENIKYKLQNRWHFSGFEIFPLVIHITEREGRERLKFEIDYQVSVYERFEIEQLFSSLLTIVKSILKNPRQEIGKINILSEQDRYKILHDFNNTKKSFPEDKTIHDLFSLQAIKKTQQTALVYKGRSMSYQELDKKTNQLAGILLAKGVNSNSIIALITQRSIEMIIGILGILKTGAAYLPIDPAYPDKRIEFMLDDCDVKIILTKRKLNTISFTKREQIIMDNESFTTNMVPSLTKSINGNILAYIMYTSGSTGKPKGVMVTHKNIIRLVKNQNYIQFLPDDKLLLTGAVGFDATTFEIWGALLNGLKLCLIDEEIILDSDKLGQVIKDNKITIMWLTAPLFNQHCEQNPQIFYGLRYLLIGGDVLTAKYVNLVKNLHPNLKIINGYGPTENTTFSTCFLIHKNYEKNIPIGKPVSNSTAYIVDKDNNLLPIGVTGELCVGGAGVARGYLNNPELTKEKFVINPFEPGTYMYRTGDLARWLPDGNIEFIGRKDFQIKIRGHRIEIGEIENQLVKYKPVKEAVILVKKDNRGNKYLCAYVVGNEKLEIDALRHFLLTRIPEYMIPSFFIKLERMPLNQNGKIDRNALPEPCSAMMDKNMDVVEPRNDLQKIMSAIWQEILGLKKVSIRDNFFHVGGDSIKAMQISAKLRQKGLLLEVADIFQTPTIESISRKIKEIDFVSNQEMVKGEVKLTPIQIWFFKQNYNDKNHFNHKAALFSKKGFNYRIIHDILKQLVKHHDALRMVFKKQKNKVIQINKAMNGELFKIIGLDLKNQKDWKQKKKDFLFNLQASFNLSQGPLLKLAHIKTNIGDYLEIIIHHLIVDGISWRILIEDFINAYKQKIKGFDIKLAPKSDSYKNWSEQLYLYANSNKILNEIEYWKRIEQKQLPQIPKDGEIERRLARDTVMQKVIFTEKQTVNLLQSVNRAYNTEINDILICGLAQTLHDWTGNDEFVINLEGHGREKIVDHQNIDRTVGWFTTQYPVVFNLNRSYDIQYLIKNIKRTLRQLPNKGLGYKILKYLAPSEYRDRIEFSLNPEISFNYLGQFDNNDKIGICEDFILESIELSTNLNYEHNFKLEFIGMILENKLSIKCFYNHNEYRKDTITHLLKEYKINMNNIIEHCINRCSSEFDHAEYGDHNLSSEDLATISNLVQDL